MVPNYGIKLLVPAAGAAVAVEDVQAHLRILQSDATETVWLASAIQAASGYYEALANRALLLSTWLMAVDAFPGRTIDEYRPPGWRYGIIRLPRAPLVSVLQMQYIDTNQVLQTLTTSQYQVDSINEPGRIAPAPYQVWPITDPLSFNAVQITFTAGYADAASVPEGCKQAIRLLVGHMYENREATMDAALSEVPFGLKSFIRSTGFGEYQ